VSYLPKCLLCFENLKTYLIIRTGRTDHTDVSSTRLCFCTRAKPNISSKILHGWQLQSSNDADTDHAYLDTAPLGLLPGPFVPSRICGVDIERSGEPKKHPRVRGMVNVGDVCTSICGGGSNGITRPTTCGIRCHWRCQEGKTIFSWIVPDIHRFSS
jgi:hypothetical protein